MKKVVVQEESSEGSDVEFNDSKKSNKNEKKDSKSNGHPQDPQKVHKAENSPDNRFVEEIEHIDFARVDKTENVKTLIRGLKLLKDDGGF